MGRGAQWAWGLLQSHPLSHRGCLHARTGMLPHNHATPHNPAPPSHHCRSWASRPGRRSDTPRTQDLELTVLGPRRSLSHDMGSPHEAATPFQPCLLVCLGSRGKGHASKPNPVIERPLTIQQLPHRRTHIRLLPCRRAASLSCPMARPASSAWTSSQAVPPSSPRFPPWEPPTRASASWCQVRPAWEVVMAPLMRPWACQRKETAAACETRVDPRCSVWAAVTVCRCLPWFFHILS